mmetsp:Transcript_5874/g.24924  ORF Transcript_5874/g.24924 Transcript_5874/m.24924 type:complete len:634 (+) Transcript_5874:1309-3210(+)
MYIARGDRRRRRRSTRHGNSSRVARRTFSAAAIAAASFSPRFASNASRVASAAEATSSGACFSIQLAYSAGVRPARWYGVCSETGAAENASIRTHASGRWPMADAVRFKGSASATRSSSPRNTAERNARTASCADVFFPSATVPTNLAGNAHSSTARSSSAVSLASRSRPFSPIGRNKTACLTNDANTRVANRRRASPVGEAIRNSTSVFPRRSSSASRGGKSGLTCASPSHARVSATRAAYGEQCSPGGGPPAQSSSCIAARCALTRSNAASKMTFATSRAVSATESVAERRLSASELFARSAIAGSRRSLNIDAHTRSRDAANAAFALCAAVAGWPTANARASAPTDTAVSARRAIKRRALATPLSATAAASFGRDATASSSSRTRARKRRTSAAPRPAPALPTLVETETLCAKLCSALGDRSASTGSERRWNARPRYACATGSAIFAKRRASPPSPATALGAPLASESRARRACSVSSEVTSLGYPASSASLANPALACARAKASYAPLLNWSMNRRHGARATRLLDARASVNRSSVANVSPSYPSRGRFSRSSTRSSGGSSWHSSSSPSTSSRKSACVMGSRFFANTRCRCHTARQLAFAASSELSILCHRISAQRSSSPGGGINARRP